jgi:hypothetical protein
MKKRILFFTLIFLCCITTVKAVTKNTEILGTTVKEKNGIITITDPILISNEALLKNTTKNIMISAANNTDSSNTYTIEFNSNGGTGTMENQVVDKNSSFSLSENLYTRTDYYFKSWNTKADGSGIEYSDKELIDSLSDDLALYAIWVPSDAVAEVNGLYFNTLASAIEEVPNNTKTTITVLKDLSENITISNKKNIVLDLQDFTLKNSSNSTVINNSGTLEIKNGTITSNAGSGAVNNNSGAKLTMSSGKVIATGTRQAIYNNGGTITISESAYLEAASTERAALHNLNNGTSNITGGTIVSKKYHAVYNEKGTLNIGQKID